MSTSPMSAGELAKQIIDDADFLDFDPFTTSRKEKHHYIANRLREAAEYLSRPSAAQDFVLVPREPTQPMLRAGEMAHYKNDDGVNRLRSEVAADIYKAMLDASPSRRTPRKRSLA